jgi:hypothetical protein
MRITTRITLDIVSGAILELEQEDYSGPIAYCKGADTANSQRQDELNMQKSAFDTQQKQLDMLNKSFSGYLGGKTGFDPKMLAAMRSQFLNSNNSTFNQAGQQVREALGARGSGTGANPVGGDYTRGIANLLGAKAGSQSQGLLGIDVNNAQQALTNQFNAGNILSGNAATLTGTQGVAGAGASSALNSYITAQGQSFGGQFLSGLGGTLGKAVGQGVSAGAGAGLFGV